MKLWILRPVEGVKDWDFQYSKCHGHIVRAENEEQARGYAAGEAGGEGSGVWADAGKTTCVELMVEGKAGHIMDDFYGS